MATAPGHAFACLSAFSCSHTLKVTMDTMLHLAGPVLAVRLRCSPAGPMPAVRLRCSPAGPMPAVRMRCSPAGPMPAARLRWSLAGPSAGCAPALVPGCPSAGTAPALLSGCPSAGTAHTQVGEVTSVRNGVIRRQCVSASDVSHWPGAQVTSLTITGAEAREPEVLEQQQPQLGPRSGNRGSLSAGGRRVSEVPHSLSARSSSRCPECGTGAGWSRESTRESLPPPLPHPLPLPLPLPHPSLTLTP